MRTINKSFPARFGCWCLLVVCLSACTSQVDSAAQLMVTTDCREAVTAQLEPLAYWQLYQYATAEIDTNGQAVLQYKTEVPFGADVKVKNKIGRVMQTVRVYVTPSAVLQIDIKGKETAFKGKTADENRDLQSFAPVFAQLYGKNADTGKIRLQVETALRDKVYASDFKEEVLKAVDLHVRVKRLTESRGDTAALQALLQELQTAHEWLSLHTWPKALDDIFACAEAEKILPSGEEGYERRLQCIGNGEVRSRYAVYLLRNLVRSRSWFGNTPTDLIRRAEPYIVSPLAREDLKSVVREMNAIDQQWEHLLRVPASAFTFETVDGKPVSLSDFRGKFVLLDVWNIFCGPCMEQIPYLKRMEPVLKEMGVEVIGISADPQDLKDRWRAVVREKGLAGTQVIMDNGRNSRFMKDYCIPNFPTFCLIDPRGYMMHPRMIYPENPDFMDFVEKKVKEYNSKQL